MRMANLWGFFICKKMARPFLPVPYPRGYERQRLSEAYYTKQKACKKPSLPLLPEKLQAKKEVINIQNYNWLYLSVWFGLRPQEIDQLKDQRLWRIETTLTERKILWVYQTKIVALPTEERWKPIPILYPEQEEALKIIESQYYKRPLVQTMRRHFGMNVHLYAGRKGFTDLMLKNGHSLESISQWMGHTTIGRTWRNYKCRTYVQF